MLLRFYLNSHLYKTRLTIPERVLPHIYAPWYIYDTRAYASMNHTNYPGKEKRRPNRLVYTLLTGPRDFVGLLALTFAMDPRMLLRTHHHVRFVLMMPGCT